MSDAGVIAETHLARARQSNRIDGSRAVPPSFWKAHICSLDKATETRACAAASSSIEGSSTMHVSSPASRTANVALRGMCNSGSRCSSLSSMLCTLTEFVPGTSSTCVAAWYCDSRYYSPDRAWRALAPLPPRVRLCRSCSHDVLTR